jgi:hypothetical protein
VVNAKGTFSRYKESAMSEIWWVIYTTVESTVMHTKKYPEEYTFDKTMGYLCKDSLRSLILKLKYSDRSFLAKDFSLSMHEIMKLHSFYGDAEKIS